MPIGADTPIVVQRDFNDWRTATARMADLRDIRWFRPRGALRPLIHANLSCTALASGELAHECDPATRPHDLLVCVLRRHTAPHVYAELGRRADAHFRLHKRTARPAGAIAVDRRRGKRGPGGLAWAALGAAGCVGVLAWLGRPRAVSPTPPRPSPLPASRPIKSGKRELPLT